MVTVYIKLMITYIALMYAVNCIRPIATYNAWYYYAGID